MAGKGQFGTGLLTKLDGDSVEDGQFRARDTRGKGFYTPLEVWGSNCNFASAENNFA